MVAPAKTGGQLGAYEAGSRALFCALPLKKNCPTIPITITTAKISVESAFTFGVTPNRIIEYTCIGSVVDPAPAVKNAMMKSSNDNVSASKNPAATPGAMSGSVTRKNVWRRFAPRSMAASSKVKSKE